ncbi:MAG TPA: hypothetical protein VLC95_13255 [Anaerolineae bacterium]|jgi:hypothetical protein|nr:hypothetical protein [Anaerolineae bacterium]
MDEQIQQAIMERLQEGRLPCAEAHAIAGHFGVDPLSVGQAADDAGIRISRCQLGLFGYGPKAEGKHKIVQPMENVPEQLAARLRAAVHGSGISCTDVWDIADDLEISRLEASNAVEALGLRVSRCQLGCFAV